MSTESEIKSRKSFVVANPFYPDCSIHCHMSHIYLYTNTFQDDSKESPAHLQAKLGRGAFEMAPISLEFFFSTVA